MGASPIKVLCVDDSALIRRLVTAIVEAEADMVMVATAPDPLIARELIKQHDPDVLTLDIEMPRMDGLDFLGKLMRLRPMPVVMLSSLTERGSDATLQALELGAVDFVTKPQQGLREGLEQSAAEIVHKIRAAAQSRPRPAARTKAGAPAGTTTAASASAAAGATPAATAPAAPNAMLFVGASTGGTEAIRRLLTPMPANMPPVLVTQHMPAGFTQSFARRLDRLCAPTVKEAEQGERIRAGHVYIAPGGERHLTVARSGAQHSIALVEAPPVNRHRPSVDVLFESAAKQVGRHALGVLLTGMGRDGADGLLKLRRAGAVTLAQDAATSVVFGMPREAIENGAAAHVFGIDDMWRQVLDLLNAPVRSATTD